MPRSAEIMATTPAVLLDNRVDVPPGDKARYSEAQFRMLRYEGTERLRRAVQEFREDPDMMESQGTAIYTNVSAAFSDPPFPRLGPSGQPRCCKLR